MLIKGRRWGRKLVFCLVFSIFLPAFLSKAAKAESLAGVPFEKDAVTANNECNSVTIGTGSSTWELPMHTYFHDSRTQVIYLAGEIGMAGSITGLALDVETAPGLDLNDWTIRMKHTTLSSYVTASFEATGWTVVYEANEPNGSTGWRTFNFSRPFKYNGIDNLMVDFSHNNNSYSSDGLCRVSTPGGIRSVYAYADSYYGDPLDWSETTSPSVFGSSNVPNIRLMFCSIIGVDFYSDGIPNFYDFSYFSQLWHESCSSPDWCGGRDLNRDGVVDINDWRTFALFWLWPAADLDMDGVVRMPDLAGFSAQWKSEGCQQPDWCDGCDFDKSGFVDIYDMANLAEYWLMQNELW
ncbi:MAG: hypothetical protein ABII09_03860 [Planctomycetota bacterium]